MRTATFGFVCVAGLLLLAAGFVDAGPPRRSSGRVQQPAGPSSSEIKVLKQLQHEHNSSSRERSDFVFWIISLPLLWLMQDLLFFRASGLRSVIGFCWGRIFKRTSGSIDENSVDSCLREFARLTHYQKNRKDSDYPAMPVDSEKSQEVGASSIVICPRSRQRVIPTVGGVCPCCRMKLEFVSDIERESRVVDP